MTLYSDDETLNPWVPAQMHPAEMFKEAAVHSS